MTLDTLVCRPDPMGPTPAKPRLVSKRTIIDRLQGLGKLDQARAALDGADAYTRERWNSRDAILANDPTTHAMLRSVGADPDMVMAPE